jgi:hypothetical protein
VVVAGSTKCIFKDEKSIRLFCPKRNCVYVLFMKTTKYFETMHTRPDRIGIKDEWIEEAINHPMHQSFQQDGRIRRWIRIPETNRYLPIVLLPDGETVHNAFFDRRFKL